MPKRIPDLKEQILLEARQCLGEAGYRALSMRLLAERCGIAVGTLYNYYSNKDALVAAITMEDWSSCLAGMRAGIRAEEGLPRGMTRLCGQLEVFTDQYRSVWEQMSSGGKVGGYTARYHQVLRQQLEIPLRQLLEGTARTELMPILPILAEALLVCALNRDLGTQQYGLLASALTPGNMDLTRKADNNEQLQRPTDRR